MQFTSSFRRDRRKVAGIPWFWSSTEACSMFQRCIRWTEAKHKTRNVSIDKLTRICLHANIHDALMWRDGLINIKRLPFNFFAHHSPILHRLAAMHTFYNLTVVVLVAAKHGHWLTVDEDTKRVTWLETPATLEDTLTAHNKTNESILQWSSWQPTDKQ